MLVSPREDAGEAQHALPCQASASALFPNNAGIAFLLRRRTSSRMWSTPCCKPTGPQGCRCWKATSWYSSHLAPRPRDTGMGGGSQPFYQGTLLAACLSEAKRATENKSWKLLRKCSPQIAQDIGFLHMWPSNLFRGFFVSCAGTGRGPAFGRPLRGSDGAAVPTCWAPGRLGHRSGTLDLTRMNTQAHL